MNLVLQGFVFLDEDNRISVSSEAAAGTGEDLAAEIKAMIKGDWVVSNVDDIEDWYWQGENRVRVTVEVLE